MTDPVNTPPPAGQLNYNPFTAPFVPRSNDPVDSLNIATPTNIANSPQIITIEQPDIDLISFLTKISTNKGEQKRTAFDSKEIEATLFTEYYKGVAALYAEIQKTYDALIEYYDDWKSAVDDQTGRTNAQNNRINNLNDHVDQYNLRIQTMNNEIAIFNATPTTPAAAFALAVTRYNNAVNTYNSYRSETINPGLANFNAQTQSNYNFPTNQANTTTLPELNAARQELELGLPFVNPFSPDPTALTQPSAEMAVTYPNSGRPVTGLNELTGLSTIPETPQIPSKTDIIETYFTPFRTALLNSLLATSTSLQSAVAYRDYVNFIRDDNIQLDPTLLSAFIQQGPKPIVAPPQAAGGSVSLASAISGISNPDLERLLSAGMYSAFASQAGRALPPSLFDRLATSSLSSLNLAALAGGSDSLRILAAEDPNLNPDEQAIRVTTAGAFLQNLIQIASSSESANITLIQNSLRELFSDLSETEALTIATSFAQAQGLSLVLLGVLAVSIAIEAPNLLRDLLSSIEGSNLADTIVAEGQLQTIPEALNDPRITLNLTLVTANSLLAARPASSPEEAVQIAKNALEQTLQTISEADDAGSIERRLVESLITQGIDSTQAAQIAFTALEFLTTRVAANNAAATQAASRELLEATEPLQTPDSAPSLQGSLSLTIQQTLTRELGLKRAQELASSLTNVLASERNPNSALNFIANRLRDYENEQSDAVREQIIAKFREFMRPEYLLYDTLRKTMDPADLFTHGRATAGIMYGNDSDPRKRGTALDIFV